MNYIITCLLLCFSLTSYAAPMPIPTPPSVAGTAYLLMDFHSRQVIAEKLADEPVEPASLTKLMTAYLVFHELKTGNIKLEDKVLISETAWRMSGSRMYVEVNTQVTVEELLKGVIIQSGNDASVALAEFIAGSEESFVTLMNQRAQLLGLKNTHYVNSTGLPGKNHYSSARDLALMTDALVRDFPEYYSWYSQKEYTYNNIKQNNRNLLLWRDKTVDGVKTGHTKTAGYCLVASAKRGEMRLISVILGTENKKVRADESQKLLNYGFRFFETYQLYGKNKVLNSERVWHGNQNTVNVGLVDPLFVTIPKGQYDQLKPTLQIDKTLIAPITAKQVYGKVKISLGNRLIIERPLVALHSVDEGNLWQRFVDYVLLQFE